MKFGPIDHVLFMGGGTHLTRILPLARDKGLSFTVVTSERHSREVIEGGHTLAAYLLAHGIPYHVSSDVANDSFVLSAITSTTLGVSLSAAWIFKSPFISRFERRFVNLHASPLPLDRGGGGSTWPILRNASKIGATIHLVDVGIDTGDIVLTWAGVLSADSLPQDHHSLIFSASEALFTRLFEGIIAGEDFPLSQQDESKSMYWPRLSTDLQGFVNWAWNADHIERFIRAFSKPYSGAKTLAFTSKGGVQVRLEGVRLTKDFDFHPFQSGIIYRIDDAGFHVAAVGGSISLLSIQSAEGTDARSFLCVGDRLYTPQDILESALMGRMIYTPKGLKG